jgi:hypothetical protein
MKIKQTKDTKSARWIACPECSDVDEKSEEFQEQLNALEWVELREGEKMIDKRERIYCNTCGCQTQVSTWICISCSHDDKGIVTCKDCRCGKQYRYHLICPQPKCGKQWDFERRPSREETDDGSYPKHTCPGCKKRMRMTGAKCLGCRKTLSECKCELQSTETVTLKSRNTTVEGSEKQGGGAIGNKSSSSKRPSAEMDNLERAQAKRRCVKKKPATEVLH